jgi:hypothetical protein
MPGVDPSPELAARAGERCVRLGVATGSVNGHDRAMEPYYLILRLTEEPRAEFVLLVPFTPSRTWPPGANITRPGLASGMTKVALERHGARDDADALLCSWWP